MKTKLLRVARPVVQFEALIAAVRQDGGRVGWLRLAPSADSPVPGPLPEELEAAAKNEVLRAVAVGGGRSVAVKPMRGEPVLRDLLREHFRGCVLVLVRGELPGHGEDIPQLELGEGGFTVTLPGHSPRHFTIGELIGALRRPRPWGSDEPANPQSLPHRGHDEENNP